ncbi:polysaccharide lyase family 8 super-sandwich domain-containing protein [Nonomuraea dietziae]|uniref:polysaccharide lyase family 8 super-sandwich domain-containing protein n=1 Tax=Nonomuraea dietziae TaxID=65515 RepID=UPI0033D37EAE
MLRRALLLTVAAASALSMAAVPAVADPTASAAPPESTAPAVSPAATQAAPDFAAPVLRYRELLTGGADVDPADPAYAAALARLDAEADAHLATLTPTGWADLQGADGNTVHAVALRLQSISLAYATVGSRRYGDAETAASVVRALTWMHAERYRPGKPETGNWYGWEIGAPNYLLHNLVLLGEAVPAELRAGLLDAIGHFVPDPARRKVSGVPEVGGNLADKVSITVRRGLLSGDAAVTTMGRDKLSPVFDHTSSGDGWYPDGSLIQHFYFAYTGGYGNALLGSTATVFALLGGTPWDLTDPDRGNVTRWIFDGFEPVMFRGQLLANVRGRGISRPHDNDYAVARSALAAMTVLAQAASPEDRQRIAALVAEHAASGGFYETATVGQIALARRLTSGVAPRGDLTLTKVYAGMDRFVHHRPGYAFTVAGRSSRVGAYEAGNNENLRGWYTGDGMTMLYNADRTQYTDGFWPTVDSYRLPGVTNATRESYPRTAKDTAWYGFRQSDPHTGGVALGDLSAFGMRTQAERDYHSRQPIDLTARKSWFTFGDTIVALGADISASDVAVQTTVENRMNPGEVRTGEGWMHIEGTGGYLFPEGMPQSRRESRTGRWSEIGVHASDEITREYETVWFDHGAAPKQASYAYYVLPGSSAEETAELAARPKVRIADNSAQVQSAIEERGANSRLAATFWSCATAASTVRAYGPAEVAMRQEGSTLEVAVSDPTWRQSQTLVEIARTGREVISADPRVTVLSTSPTIRLAVDTAGALGAAVTVQVKVRPTARPPLAGAGCEGSRVRPDADAYARGGAYAGRNFNGQGLVAKTVADQSYARQSFLRFARPEGEISLARLWLRGAIADAGGTSTTLTLYEAPAGWEESTLTWAGRPALGRAIGEVTITGSTPAWYSIDLTAHLRAGGSTSFALAGPSGVATTLAAQFADRETPDGAPYLQVF